jgi:hypothetical protein
MDRRSDEDVANLSQASADLHGMQGIGVKGQMTAVLFGGAEREQHSPGLFQSSRKFGHGHFRNYH